MYLEMQYKVTTLTYLRWHSINFIRYNTMNQYYNASSPLYRSCSGNALVSTTIASFALPPDINALLLTDKASVQLGRNLVNCLLANLQQLLEKFDAACCMQFYSTLEKFDLFSEISRSGAHVSISTSAN